MITTHSIVLILGSNIGDRENMLVNASHEIEKQIGIVYKKSMVYESKAWGNENQNDFLNQVIICHTHLSPHEALDKILTIEKNLGRIRVDKWQARNIDIDILYYDDVVVNALHLHIPHKHLHERKFVLIPLVEIDGNGWHPIFKKTNNELLFLSDDTLQVTLYNKKNL